MESLQTTNYRALTMQHRQITSFGYTNETASYGVHSFNYVMPDYSAAFARVTTADYLNLKNNKAGVASTFAIGLFLKSSRELTLDAQEAFIKNAPTLNDIQNNHDLTRQAKERQCAEIIKALVPKLSVQAVALDLSNLLETMKNGVYPAQPLPAGDVIAEMRDQEARRFIANYSDRKALFAEMVNGEHPELVAAVLRAVSPVVSGILPKDAERLHDAAIADKYSADLFLAREFIYVMNEARIAAYRSFSALLTIGGLVSSPEFRIIADQFNASPDVTEFRQWIDSFPIVKNKVLEVA